MIGEDLKTGDGRSYVKLCRDFLETEARMLREAQLDAEKYPTPTRLAKALNVEVPLLLEIMEFAKTDFGEYEADRIAEAASMFMDYDGTPLPGDSGMFI